MILDSIVLENIRSYSKEKIEFPKGITLFEGDIGSGKSSVLMGIEFALFGLGSQKAESLLSKKATEGSVTLSFEVDGQKYEIKRKLKRKGGSVTQDARGSYLMSDGESEPLSPTELKQRVLQILNFNEPGDPHSESRIFRYAVFTPQEEMKQVLRDPRRRLETIRRAFGVEDYKTAVENAKSLSSGLKTQMAVFQERFSKIDENEKELEEMKTTFKNLGKILSNLDVEKNKIQTDVEKLEDDKTKLQKKEKNKIELESKNESIQSKIESHESLLESYDEQIEVKMDELDDIKSQLSDIKKIKKPTDKTLPEIEKVITKFSKIRDGIISLKSKKGHLDVDITRLEKFLGPKTRFTAKQCQEKIIDHKKRFEQTSKELEGLEEQIEKQKEVKIKAESQIETLKEKLDNVAKLGATCPYCDHKLTKDHIKKLEKERKEKLVKNEKVLEDSEKKLAELLSEQDGVNITVTFNHDAVQEIEGYLPNLREWHEKSGNIITLQNELKVAQAQIVISEEKSFPNDGRFENPVEYMRSLRDVLVEYHNASKQNDDLEKRQNSAESIVSKNKNLKSQVGEKISQLQKDIKEIQTKLKSFVGLDEKISKVDDKLAEKNETLSETKEMIVENKTNQRNFKDQITKLKEEISQAEKWQVKHAKFSNYFDWLREFFIPTVEQIEKQVLLSIQQNFNEIYRRWYSILIDDSTKESRIDEEFTPIIEQDGYEQDVDYLSGGEKTSIALAYRLTLNSMMRQETDSLKSNLLILDEPTDGFSKTQLSKVRDVLQELKSQQIILVSHEKELETYVDNIFQITKQDGVSQVVRLSN